MSLKHSLLKKWQRITESRYTKAFVLTSIIQTVILVFLQLRLLYRNAIILEDIEDSKHPECEFGVEVFALLMGENVMFIIFDLYQMYFSLNAIFHQNTMQLFAIFIITVGHIILGIIQLSDVKLNIVKIGSECSRHIDYNIRSYELPYIIALTIIAILTSGLTWKLYQQFGWNIYKKIGGDIDMQRRFKTSLIFVLLLKINLLFVIIFNFLVTPLLIFVTIITKDLFSTGEKTVIYGGIAISLLVFLFQILAYKSMEKEWKIGMVIFIILWIIAIADFGFLAFILGILLVPSGIYSWTILICIFIICAVLTLVYAILVTRNLGKGLKEYYSKKQKHEGSNIEDEEAPNSSNRTKRIIIDD